MGNPVRILHAMVNMNRGGAETLVMNIYRKIDRSRIQFDFLTSKQGVFDAEIIKLGGNVFRIPYITDVGHSGYVKALDHFFATHSQYQIVHAHMDKMSGLVLKAAKKHGVPVRIAHSHNTSSEGGMVARVYKWFAGRYIPSSATNYLACSNRAAKWLFPSIESINILKNGIEYQQYLFSIRARNHMREQLGIPNQCFVVGHVGRFNAQKNHAFLLDIFQACLAQHPHSILLLAGDGERRVLMERQAKKMGISDRVRFLGVRDDIHLLLQAFDVFLFPSLHEGLPLTVIEAQCAGLPCVISDTITAEVDLGASLVTYLSLNQSSDVWAKRLLVHRMTGRYIDMDGTMLTKGYSIEQTTIWLQNYYTSIAR